MRKSYYFKITIKLFFWQISITNKIQMRNKQTYRQNSAAEPDTKSQNKQRDLL